MPTPKQPSDSALIKGFDGFEKSMNVYMAWMRNHPDPETSWDFKHEIESMWAAHAAYRKLAAAAHERIEAKKGNKDAQ